MEKEGEEKNFRKERDRERSSESNFVSRVMLAKITKHKF